MSAIAAAAIGGGAVADDRNAGCWTVYFSRPVSRLQYALGKLAGVSFVTVCLYVLPSILLWLIAIGVSQADGRAELWALGPATLGISTLGTLFIGSTILAVSAAGPKARSVAVIYGIALFLIAAISARQRLFRGQTGLDT